MLNRKCGRYTPGVHGKDLIMDLLNVAAASVGSILMLFLLTKLIGNKQMSQLNLFDYINGITIGSIAAEMATSLENDFLKPLLAMSIYALATILSDLVSNRWIGARRFLEGRSIILYDNGKLYRNHLKRARMDLSEFLTQCRTAGYYSLDSMQLIVMEANGRLSFLPKPDARPATPADFGKQPQPDAPQIPVVMDGKVLTGNLQESGKDLQWLNKQLSAQHYTTREVLLALCNPDNTLSVYKKETAHKHTDRFQ